MARRPRRPDVELWGWSEFMQAAERTDTGLRWMRDTYDDFPVPLAELNMGPVYLADECRLFLDSHPKTSVGEAIPDGKVARIFALHNKGVSVKKIAEQVGVSEPTVYRRLAERRNAKGRRK